MESQYNFSQEILQQPAAAKFSYFQNVIIWHPKLVEVKTELARAIKYSADSSMVFLCGPSGVGISTVFKLIAKEHTESLVLASKQNQALASVNGFEMLPFEFNNQIMKGFYIRALHSLTNSPNNYLSLCKQSELSLRLTLEKSLREHKTKLFYVDDAHHLIGESKTRDLEKRVSCIMSLAKSSGVQFMLGGNYDFAKPYMWFYQLYRRSKYIELSRYDFDDRQDLRNYLKVVEVLLNLLPLKTESDLLKHHAFYCERSIGCVGLLKDWLLRALAAALEGGCSALSIKHLEHTALTAEQCRSLLIKAQRGECSSEKGVPDSKLQAALGLMKKKDF